MNLDVEFRVEPKLLSIISELEEYGRSRRFLDEATAFSLNQIRTRFLDQRSPDGEAWVPSQAALRRAATGKGGGTLFDTGRLFHSIAAQKDGNDRRRIFTDVPYARDHQEGLNGNLKREFMGLAPADEVGIKNLLERAVNRLAR